MPLPVFTYQPRPPRADLANPYATAFPGLTPPMDTEGVWDERDTVLQVPVVPPPEPEARLINPARYGYMYLFNIDVNNDNAKWKSHAFMYIPERGVRPVACIYRRIKGCGGCRAASDRTNICTEATPNCSFVPSNVHLGSTEACTNCHQPDDSCGRSVPLIFQPETNPAELRKLVKTNPIYGGVLRRTVREMLRQLLVYSGIFRAPHLPPGNLPPGTLPPNYTPR